LLGVFAKFPDFEPVKTRLRSLLTAEDAARFHMAALADVLETVCRVTAHPVLFLSRGADEPDRVQNGLIAAGLLPVTWSALTTVAQQGENLGERLEHAFGLLCDSPNGDEPALVLGSDSPSLESGMIRAALDALRDSDVVLGPTTDGGYWTIGVRQPFPTLLDGVPWSTTTTFEATAARARVMGLRVATLATWTDVDEPADLNTLASQIAALRARGDFVTGRRSERILAALGVAFPPSSPGPLRH
jgi:rSAM/selenodomain-associated transferase 1